MCPCLHCLLLWERAVFMFYFGVAGSLFNVPQLTQFLHLEKLLREAVRYCEMLKMATSG